MKFTDFVTGLFLDAEKPEVVATPEVPETPEVVAAPEVVETPEVIEEPAPEYMLKDDVEELIASTVTKTVEAIQLSAQKSSEALKDVNVALTEKIEKLELAIHKPAGTPAKIVPPVGATQTSSWSMAKAVNQ